MVDLFENKNFDNLVNLSNMEAERQMKVFSNFVSPEFIERERQKGKVTFLEAAQNAKKWGYATPFFGTALEMGNNAVVLNTLNKLKSGAVLSNEENSQLKEYVQDMASLSARGMTLPANCMNSFMENVPFLFEFGTAFATAPTGVGFAGIGQAGAKLAAKQLAKKGVKDLTKNVINRQVAKNVLKDSTVGVGRMMLQKEMMLNNAKRYTDVQLADKLYLTEEGQAILNESEQSPAKALLKTIGLQGIEILSETTGFAFDGVGKWLGHGLASKLPKKFVDELGSTINKVTGLAPYKALKKYGWNGVVEEMGEERAGDLLKVAFNLDDEKGYSYEQFLNALYPGKEELLTEAITFAITGGLMGGAVELHNKHKKNEIYRTVVNDIKSECTNEDGSFDFDKMKTLVKENMPSISDERLNKYIDTVKNDIKNVKDYSVEDFLLDSGVFRQTGRYGVVDKAVLNALKDSDMSDEDKMNILNYVSTTDKKNFVNLMSKLNPDSNVTPERQKLANYVQNSFYNQLSKNGVSSNIAFSTSVLFSNLAKKSTVDVEKFKQWFDKTYITTEDLPAKMKQGLFQSAMYKDKTSNNAFEFYNNVQNDLSNYKTAKYQFKNLKLSLPADTIKHDEKHELTADDWNDIEQNINNIYIANKINGTSSFGNDLYNLGIKADNGSYYYLCIALNNKDNYIVTATKNTKSGVDSFVTGKGKTPSKVPNALLPVAPFSKKSSTDIINYVKQKLNPNVNNHEDNQSNKESIEKTVQDKFGCSVDELTENIKQDVINALVDNNISDSEFNIQDIRLYGSYSKGTNKATSDLDFIVQYDGSMKEDSAFNILHDVINTIEDKNGNKVTVDINPINVNESGTIDEHVAYMNSLDNNNNVYYQSAYHGTPHKFDEFSTEHIGTGEGAQAHGWGLYFAGNKDVSENYRKELARINNLDLFGPVPVDVYYDGKHATEYFTFADFSLALELVGTQDKKAGIDYLKNEINECQKRIDEFKEDMKKRPMETPAFKQQIEDEKDYISELNKQIDFINNLDVNKLEVEKRNQGQLFEVDIPENDVLLDEDKPLNEQPEKVRKMIFDYMKDNQDNFILPKDYNSLPQMRGHHFYREVALIERKKGAIGNGDKEASLKLNEYGIKGITYDGRQDGRCYVIFDDKAVNVIKTYYQSMLSGIDKDQKVNVLDLTSAFGSDANLSKKDLTNYIKSLIGSNPISTSDKKAIVNFIARSKRTGKGNVYIPSHIANSSKVETNNKGVRNTVVNNIVDLIKNSVLIDKSENRDKQTKPNVDYYYRCYVPVRVNNDIYTVRITLENNEKDNLFNIINGNVYDVIIDKKMTSAHSMTNSQSSLMKSSSNSNIPQNNKNVTSDQITIEDMLKDVLDSEGNSYFQNNEDSETKQKLLTENIEQKKNDLENKLTELTWSDSSEDNSSMIESISQDIETLERFLEKGGYDEISEQSQADEESKELLSAVQKIMGVQKKSKPLKDSYSELLARRKEEEEKYKGFFIQQNDKNIIGILSNSDSSTIIHEMGHLFLSGLNEFAQYDEESKKQLEMVNSWLGSNGSEYTTEQAEKFARSFEAYLYKGKAPNVGLRGVFEKFKDWLHSIYVNISSIPGADISDEAQEVFDRLFSGEEYFEKVKAINTLVKKINNIRVAKSYTDMEKRHRQAAYEVVAVATGYPVNYIRNILGSKSKSKRIEKLQENILSKVEHTDDKLSVHGYNPEWAEFGYSLADIEDATNDIEVALKAYDDLLNQSFMTEVVDEYGLSDDADVQYKTLLKEYKKNKSNRDVVLGAFYDWIESLTDIEKDLYSNKFENDVTYIERFEKLDKFEQAKITILEKARELKTFGKGSEYENYKALVVETMKNLDFLTPSDKARMTTTILDMPSLTFLESGIDSILDIAKTLDDRAYRKHLMDLINKEIQSTKNVKQGNKTVGKYDYLTNKVFEEIREYNKLSVEQANEKRLALANLTEAEENGLTFEQKLIMKFLTYKANGTRYGTTENVKSMYDDICLMKKLGKKCKSDMELFEKLNNKHQIDELVNILKNKKKAKGIAKFYNNCVANWESCLNFIFNKSIKDKHSLLIPETNTMVWIHNAKKKFESQVANIYGLKSWNFDHAILDNLATKDTFIETTNRKYDLEGKLSSCDFVERELNKMQMLHVWIGYQNDVIKQRLINQWGEENIERMFNYLTDKDEALGRLLISTCQSFYPEVNNVFINKYGIDLPKVQSYFPSTPRHESEVDLLTDFAMKSSSPSMIKHRTKAETLPMELHNPVEIIYNHIDKCGRFINMTYKLDILNKIFKSETVEKMVSEIYGKDAYKTLKQQLINVSYKTNSTVFDGYKKMLNGVISNWIQGNVIIRPIVGLKQLLSASNYAVDMPVIDWSKGFLKALVHPKQTIDYMMKIPYLQARYNGSAQNEFLKETVENSKFAKVKTLKEFLSLNIRIGDIGAIIFGGKPYIDYLIKTGMSEDEAIEQFILSTQRSQQSSATSSLGNFQIDMGKNPFGKLFTAYKNSPYQYIRMCSDAIISVANGDMTKRQCAKVLFNFAYFQPLLYTLATSGSVFRLLFSGDDDDLKSDLITSLFNLNANAFAFIGDVYQFALNRLVYKNKYLPQSTPLLGDLQTEIMKISKEDVSLEDYLGLSAEIIHIGTGIPAGKVWEQSTSIGDFVNGDVATGVMKMLGYTSKRAKHITNSDND